MFQIILILFHNFLFASLVGAEHYLFLGLGESENLVKLQAQTASHYLLFNFFNNFRHKTQHISLENISHCSGTQFFPFNNFFSTHITRNEHNIETRNSLQHHTFFFKYFSENTRNTAQISKSHGRE
jgi:hypothetical protein